MLAIYMHAFTHTYMRSYIHTCVHIYIHAFTHTYMRSYIHTCVHTHIHAFIYTYMRSHTHTCVHIYIHVFIHTNMQKSCTTYLKSNILPCHKYALTIKTPVQRAAPIKDDFIAIDTATVFPPQNKLTLFASGVSSDLWIKNKAFPYIREGITIK